MKKTAEELMVMAEERGVKLSPEKAKELAMQELPDETVEDVASGFVDYSERCSKNYKNGVYGFHNYKQTGNTRPGYIWGLNYEVRCTYCGKTDWEAFNLSGD